MRILAAFMLFFALDVASAPAHATDSERVVTSTGRYCGDLTIYTRETRDSAARTSVQSRTVYVAEQRVYAEHYYWIKVGEYMRRREYKAVIVDPDTGIETQVADDTGYDNLLAAYYEMQRVVRESLARPATRKESKCLRDSALFMFYVPKD